METLGSRINGSHCCGSETTFPSSVVRTVILQHVWLAERDDGSGDPTNIQLTGLSAGAHSVHQILHHVSHLPEGESSPFQSAMLQSNAILYVLRFLLDRNNILKLYRTTPKTPSELRLQFIALCKSLNIDPASPTALARLRALPWRALTHVIETDAVGPAFGSFRGALDGIWLAQTPDPMAWQRSGAFARGLRAHGVRSIVLGDLTEEWYLYSIAHPVHVPSDVRDNVRRYYPDGVVEKMLACYPPLPQGASKEEMERYMGEVLADGQVHFPVRLLARDLLKADFPVLRYEIRWTPEQVRPYGENRNPFLLSSLLILWSYAPGYVTHGTDRFLWTLRLPILTPAQIVAARTWLDVLDAETKALEEGLNANARDPKKVLALREDKTVAWKEDEKWDHLMRLRVAIPTEHEPVAGKL